MTITTLPPQALPPVAVPSLPRLVPTEHDLQHQADNGRYLNPSGEDERVLTPLFSASFGWNSLISETLQAYPYLDVPVVGGPHLAGTSGSVTAQLRIVPAYLVKALARLDPSPYGFETYLDTRPQGLPTWQQYPTDEQLLDTIALGFSPAGIYTSTTADPDPLVRQALAILVTVAGTDFLGEVEQELTHGLSIWGDEFYATARARLLDLACAYHAAYA